jgi:hypothetical protein
MGISRGFRRLSVLTAFLGLVVIVFLWSQPGSNPTVPELIFGFLLFVGVPVLFVLLLGWVVAGFQNSN